MLSPSVPVKLICILGTAACGGVVALLAARKRGIYFSLLAIAFGVMFWFLVFVLNTWTGGEDGLTGLQGLSVGGIDLRRNRPLNYFVYAFFVAASILLWRIVHSPFGQVIGAIKQSETRARAVGYDTPRYKAIILFLPEGILGVVKRFRQPTAFHDTGEAEAARTGEPR